MKGIELYFFRHGIAVDRENPGVTSDQERPLTEEGIRKTRGAAEGLKRLDVSFDKILTSPWLRATQTAEILAEVLAVGPVEILPDLAGDRTVDELLTGLAQHHAQHMLLVGHEPLLGKTVGRLLGSSRGFQIDLKKGGACAIEIDAISPQESATLLWLMTSKQLRMIGKNKGI